MLSEQYELDEIDRQIFEIVQEEPTLTHTKIAKKIKRSQPTVGLRIKRLQESGILQFQAGFNLKKSNIFLAKADIQSSKGDQIKEIINDCPHMLHGFRMSGLNDFIVIIGCSSIKELDSVVNYHFRKNPNVSKVKLEIITEIYNDFVLHVDSFKDDCECTRDLPEKIFQEQNVVEEEELE